MTRFAKRSVSVCKKTGAAKNVSFCSSLLIICGFVLLLHEAKVRFDAVGFVSFAADNTPREDNVRMNSGIFLMRRGYFNVP